MTPEQNISAAETHQAIRHDKKVEVTVEGSKAVVRLLSYGNGIGWFIVKTIKVDAEMLDALADQFADARGKIRRDGDDILSAEILEF